MPRFAFVAAVVVLAALPLALVWWHRGDYLCLSNESIAYRYFLAARLADHETPAPWALQGHTLGLWHRLVYALLPDGPLRDRLNLFGLVASLLPLAIVAGTLAWTALRRESWTRLALLAVVVLVPIYGAGMTGWSWWVTPDYLSLNSALLPLVVLLTWHATPNVALRHDLSHAALLGVLVGLAAANKVSMVPVVALAAVAILVSAGRRSSDGTSTTQALCRWRSQVRVLSLAPLVAVLTFATVFLLLYDFRFDQALRAWDQFRSLLAASSAGAGEGDFWQRLPELARAGNYGWLIGAGLAGIIWSSVGEISRAVTSGKARSPACCTAGLRSLLLFLALLAVAGFLLYAVVRRPASTTLYETAVMLFALGALALGAQSGQCSVSGSNGTTHPGGTYHGLPFFMTCRTSLPHPSHTYTWYWLMTHPLSILRTAWVFVLGAAVLMFATFPVGGMLTTIQASRSAADQRWAMHQRIMSPGRRVVVVIRDNTQTLLSVEELLLKGFADMPIWDVLYGRAGLERHAPGLSFRTVQSLPGQLPGEPYPDDAMIVVFVRQTPSAVDEFPALGAAVARRTCERVEYGGPNVVLICVP